MDITKLRDIKLSDTDEIYVTGWIDSIRFSKKTVFFELRDEGDPNVIIQCVISIDLGNNLKKEGYVKLRGNVSKLPEKYKTKRGFEFHVKEIVYYNDSDSDFSEKIPDDAGTDTKFNQRHLYVRSQEMRVHALLIDLVLDSCRSTFKKMGFVEIIPPLFGGTKCEGGSNTFEMDHMGTQVYLTQSSQMYLEAMVPSLGSVYCIQPSFRKEKSHTRRHLTCFTHIEAELPNILTLEDFYKFLESFVRTLLQTIIRKDKKGILDYLNTKDKILKYLEKGFKILNHSEAVKMVSPDFKEFDDIPEAEERKLIDQIDQIVFLSKFPTMTKAFYTATDANDKNRALAVDVEFPGVGEIIGSSMRESSYEKLKQNLRLYTLRDASEDLLHYVEDVKIHEKVNNLIIQQDTDGLYNVLKEIVNQYAPEKLSEIDNIPYSSYEWYFDMRKYGHSNTAGFGLGMERIICWLADAANIKEVTMFPRFDGRLSP